MKKSLQSFPHSTKSQGDSSTNRECGRGREEEEEEVLWIVEVSSASIVKGMNTTLIVERRNPIWKSQEPTILESFEYAKHSTFFTCNLVEEPQKHVWFLDSGCSNHMIGKFDLFVKLDDSVRSQVKFDDDKEVDVIRKGTFAVKSKQGLTTFIHDTLHMPKLQITA